ncbi:MAG: malto-oligosyltrehalose synthase [Acidobacteriia bacterium]|nr:malto-oligosyltrehalose synthase [Terriglobia bacterium]
MPFDTQSRSVPPTANPTANDPVQVPITTYRLQFNRTFTFRDAAALVPYLASLGISHCYSSPYLRARPGSMHGYDIIDHNALNPEIGSPEDYEYFIAELHRHGMGQILDLVPNHMGVMGSDNAWWLDVLENGEASEYADFFDIDWEPIKDELQGKVLVPILEDQYGNVLESGELKLALDIEHGEFSLFYRQNRFPVDPREYPRILGLYLDAQQENLGATREDFLELRSIMTAFGHLPGRGGLSPEQRAEHNREKEVQKRRLASLLQRSPLVRDFVTGNVEVLNGKAGDPQTFDALHELIKAQAYRLAQWRVAADDINYRRFFDVNELAALCMDNDAVFAKTHRFVIELAAQGKVDGFRIDHPDGLYDPKKYLDQLQGELKTATATGNGAGHPVYIVVEKILTGEERLRPDWPIHGTTGYEFANLVNGLFVDARAASKMERIYRSFSGRTMELADLVYACKKLILKVSLASELNVLANLLSRIALSNRHTCDFTLNSLRSALAEIIASFPVYRTYVSGNSVSAEDRRYVQQAVMEGRKRSNAADLSVFDFVHRMLLIEINGSGPQWYKRAITRFSMKFQQLASAVMAKGVEDTAFYRYNRLVSLNDVGGNPAKFGTTVDEFHRANQQRLHSWPHSMLASSTHDSKRSEDVRARINVLSEIPALWRLKLRRWRDWNRGKRRLIDGRPAPTRNDEYLLYQTLVGAWPLEALDDGGWQTFSERIEQYMLKAAREAKEQTSWANSNLDYEGALLNFTRAVLKRDGKNRFLADFSEFQEQTARAAMFSSLSQCLLKLTSPGVPDIYQGNELWELNLVDPDNRCSVDYDRRRQLLDRLQQGCQSPQQLSAQAAALLANMDNGLAKLYLTWRTLGIRRKEPLLFQQGSYIPLQAVGQRSEHICAFAREYEGQSVIVAVPRLCATLLGQNFSSPCSDSLWSDTQLEIPDAKGAFYHDVFTGECLPLGGNQQRLVTVARLLRDFPVAFLFSEPLS